MGLITSAKMIGSYAARLLAAADTDIYALLLVRIDRLEERVGALDRPPDDPSKRELRMQALMRRTYSKPGLVPRWAAGPSWWREWRLL